jgi:hypothetical protein
MGEELKDDNIDDVRGSFCEELEHVFDKFPKYHVTILLHFNAKVGMEDIFKPAIGNESLHEITIDNGVRAVNFDPSKSLTVKSRIFPYYNVHEFTWKSPDGKISNKINHTLVHGRWHASIRNV